MPRIGAVMVVAIGLTVACGGSTSSPSGPSPIPAALDPACPPSAQNPNCAPTNVLAVTFLVATFDSGGPFNFTFLNVPITGTSPAAGNVQIRVIGVSPGVQEVSGELLTNNLQIQVGAARSNVFGGPVSGTVENIEGPLASTPSQGTTFISPGISRCGIHYRQPQAATAPVRFRFRFTITGMNQPQNDPTACR